MISWKPYALQRLCIVPEQERVRHAQLVIPDSAFDTTETQLLWRDGSKTMTRVQPHGTVCVLMGDITQPIWYQID